MRLLPQSLRSPSRRPPRWSVLPALCALGLLSSGPVANAQQSAAVARFDATFEIVVDNCGERGIQLNKASVSVTNTGKRVSLSIPNLPTLQGKARRRGKLRADGEGPANADGISARYGINGRISGDKIAAVFVAEYYKGDKPQCTQSWSLSGVRSKR